MNLEEIHKLRELALRELEEVSDLSGLEAFRIKFLGKKGELTQALKSLKDLPLEEKKRAGSLLNELKIYLEEALFQKRKALIIAEEDKEVGLDLTLPGRRPERGTLHPLTLIIEEICAIFTRLGFEIVTGPEVESDYYNFTALNIPEWHPARDMQATFYLKNGALLRTHTSPMQIRAMLERTPPLRIIAPGKVYRCDADVRHSPMFHQVEGLMIDEKVSFSDLKGILSFFARETFGEKTRVRFRPSYFPFTEPSVEMDISCVICDGKGCRVCSQTGWLEILGAGMVHPEVLKGVNYDTSKWQGFAFGLGVERIAMIKFEIDDIRLFFDNHLYFLESFK
ncbi:phenylalanyl-tRNA synthetase subunit alpha [Caldimicrobium thiodismutans]|jgi:phenylalanyl-tRNA synthetase alpha chain|uniref:Phenylalanine--tRNA ligase alpha subunit n=1 Tax=Caldimicrobium thiodismutans TaxID=1653476 RepID=A0A0U4N382_9BACT|nr:phenylalanine--tRNA ligase subunit alpha [Caldimicrobium thiodismutans]BAU23766.1 phenylalanyl-tRNA synthetase subunit alpha [Caldimicrobium thiodismutans]